MQEVILFYKGLEVPTREILDSKGAIPTMTTANARIAIQEMAEHSQKWHDGTSTRTESTKTYDGLAAIQGQLNNLGREIKKVNEKVYAAQVGCELCKGPHYTKDCLLKKEGKTLAEAYYTQFGVPFPQGGSSRYALSAPENSKLLFEPRQVTIPFPSRLYDDLYDEEKGSYELKYLDAYSIRTTLCNDALPRKEKTHIMPFSTYTNLGLRELAHTKLTVELADRTVKRPKGISENVLVRVDSSSSSLSLFKEKKELDVDILSFLEEVPLDFNIDDDVDALPTLVVPFVELRRNQLDDVEPTIKEVKVIDEPMINRVKTKCDNKTVDGLNEYPSYCAFNLKFSCLIGNDSVTYQMARSHSRFKHLTNAQCNKMQPLLKVSAQDELKGISHPYQKLKGFYKEVLNLGLKYIKNEKVEEWLTYGHVSIHEKE
nr:hypothetical protein [Tanacetum cinerariifolium]